MRLRWIFVLALLAAFFGWKYINDGKEGFEIKRTIDFKGVVERMKEKNRLEQLERAKSKDYRHWPKIAIDDFVNEMKQKLDC